MTYLTTLKITATRAGTALLIASLACLANPVWARDVDYKDQEITVKVAPGEPTQIRFPGIVSGGFKKRMSTLALDKKDTDLVIFASDGLTEQGEAIIVRLQDGRSYSLRLQRATDIAPRDDVVTIRDTRASVLGGDDDDEVPTYKDRNFGYAPPSVVSGFMRELVLVGELGKDSIPGYRMTDRFKGEKVLDDGTMIATVDKIYMGPNFWGYVINAENKLDTAQKINPATFRLDGTRAVSLQNWELAARPITAEQQIAGKHKTKVYIITRARK